MQVFFKFEKETKNTIRFKEIGERPVIGTTYIQKSALKELEYKQGETIVINISKEE